MDSSLYRSGITTADVLSLPAPITSIGVRIPEFDEPPAPIGLILVKVLAGNVYGRSIAVSGDAISCNGTTDLVRISVQQVPEATFYDIFLSMHADPHFVARVTEAQRASGAYVNGQNLVGPPRGSGPHNSIIDVAVSGNGRASGTTTAVNTAYVMPTESINASPSWRHMDLDVQFSVTGDSVAPRCVLVPFFFDNTADLFSQGAAMEIEFGGVADKFNSNRQRMRVETRSNRLVKVVVALIEGQGAAVSINYSLS